MEWFKHGMKVKCRLNGMYIEDARLSYRPERGAWYICQNERGRGSEAPDKLGYRNSWPIYDGTEDTLRREYVENLRPAKDIKDIDTYEVGDIILNEEGKERRVLAVCGEMVALSNYSYSPEDGLDKYGSWLTTYQVSIYGYSFKEEVTNSHQLEGTETEVEIDGKNYKVKVLGEIK